MSTVAPPRTSSPVEPQRRGSAVSALLAAVLALLLQACATDVPSPTPSGPSPGEARAMITRLIPASVADRGGWATDIYAALAVQRLRATRENVCAVLAIIEQESTYRADPSVPGLPAIAWREIDARAERAGVPRLLVHGALQLTSPNGRSYSDRIDAVKSEKELSEIFEDFISMVPLGTRLFGTLNPVRTGGPMQVGVAFAEQHAAAKPYPYPLAGGRIRQEVFTRRGGLYFGIAHLLDYPADYDQYIHRFADFNAGQYASRNAAFQSAVSSASGIPLVLDGDLVAPEASAKGIGATERAVRTLGDRLGMDDVAIRRALDQERGKEFERTTLYPRVFALAERAEGRPLPRAVIPRIRLESPKITRNLTTEWFATRVDERFKRCLTR